MSYDILHGDVLEQLATLPGKSVDAVVTDPPYELGFMGKSWDSTGIAYSVPMWREVLRVLKPGGHLLSFGGSRTYHRMACAIEDAGFEIRDQIMWLYGSGFPKSRNLNGEWSGWGTALKPSHEPIVLARKPLIGTVAQNVLEHGTGALNIDGCRVETTDTLTGSGSPPLKYAGQNSRPFHEAAEPRGCNQNALGRWPANLIHDGSDEVLEEFAKYGKKTSGAWDGNRNTPKTDSIYGDFESRKEGPRKGDTGTAARFFYCAKASKSDRGAGNGHPTVKPTELMQYLCRLITPPSGAVLDPFSGSGSTGKAALREGFSFIGMDQDGEHVDLAHDRICGDAPLFNTRVVRET